MTVPKDDAQVTFGAPSAQELSVERILHAPRERVFAAWSTPGQLAKWWGPRGFENDVREMDVRPGGRWRIVQRGPDGTLHPFHGVYLEVSPPDRIAFTQYYDVPPMADQELRVAVEFADAGAGRTRVLIAMRFTSQEDRDEQVRRGMTRGMQESLERLSELLRESEGDPAAIVATRMLGVPREKLFALFTDPAHLARWWGPRGFTTSTQEFELREGGIWRFTMRGPDGREYPNEIAYLRIEPPERLVYQHTVPPWFEHEVTFVELGGKTRVMVRMRFLSAQERARAEQEFGAVQGLEETLARLAELAEGN